MYLERVRADRRGTTLLSVAPAPPRITPVRMTLSRAPRSERVVTPLELFLDLI